MSHSPEVVDCTDCGVKPARNFVTNIVHGVVTQVNLCEDCFATSQFASEFERPNLDGAKCDYCGDPATSGSPKPSWDLASPNHGLEYSCTRCLEMKAEQMKELIGDKDSSALIGLGLDGLVDILQEVDSRVRRRLDELDM